MAEIYFRFFLKKSLIQTYRLKLFNGMYIHLLISFFFSCLGCWQMEQDTVSSFLINYFSLSLRALWSIDTIFNR